jgi:hypothetical protein
LRLFEQRRVIGARRRRDRQGHRADGESYTLAGHRCLRSLKITVASLRCPL